MKFFGKDNLNGFTYSLILLSKCKREHLTKKIKEYKGVNFHLPKKTIDHITDDCIMIIESNKCLNMVLRMIQNRFNFIHFYNNNDNEKEQNYLLLPIIEMNDNSSLNLKYKKELRIISYEDIIIITRIYEEKNIAYHYKNGLPIKYRQEDLISMISHSKDKKELTLRFHVFQNDFPRYYCNVNEGFSIFMTKNEKEIYDNFQINGIKKKENKCDMDYINTPIPNSNFCHLCRVNYKDYKYHVNKDLKHLDSLERKKENFNRLESLFTSIRHQNRKEINMNNTISFNTTIDTSTTVLTRNPSRVSLFFQAKNRFRDLFNKIESDEAKRFEFSNKYNPNYFDKIGFSLEEFKLIINN